MSKGSSRTLKDSGVGWLGEIPESWDVKPFWTLYRREKSTGHPDEELLSVYRDYGVIPKSSRDDNGNVESEDLNAYQLVDVDDLVMNKMKAWQGSIAVSDLRGIVSPAYFVFKPCHKAHGPFLHHLLRSKKYIGEYNRLSKGIRVGQWDLEPIAFRTTPVILPPYQEQVEIASFLERETAQIDALIEKQQQLIHTLGERRKAVITRVVTRGLDTKAPFKESTVEWLGPVPAHWEIKRLKEANLYLKGGVWGEEPSGDGFDIWCVRMADFDRNKQTISLDKQTYRNVKPSERINRVLKYGDLILEKSGGGDASPVGAVMHFGHHEPAVCSNFACILRIKPDQDSKFWAYVHHAIYANRLTWRSIKQTSGIQNLDTDSYFNERIGFPPLTEQRNIVAFLENAMVEIDTLIDKATSTIELLQERRQALISAAVTGKIDVRGK